ncbi:MULTISPECIES: alcohol dehydrogenase catalytic domain-containing protein [unclassified Microbacterium]|uniref:zinc-dependent alcohol dehydrogenase n=1 Tax=unclassified Microbacterium TaxID=2609290 RepID=UPI00214AF325|nr:MULTISPECIES: alcohol dehydrogenase catalytic domain-containing protein [unclassified Microbacterium]MCR2808404.1 alcohol dehydrogenase catalytic domain-containing protein [Microbacterium sp. zg.B185]WIM19150.1 alcohol dehydrogenase catalytic domain-containing protein [Microbacterium sp. zg-B185]
MQSVRAAVLIAPNQLKLTEFPYPSHGEDAAIIRVEAAGLCGSDVEQVRGEDPRAWMGIVPGHEPLGVVESIGRVAAERWGVDVGDRICVEVVVPCQTCPGCLERTYVECRAPLGGYGYRPFKAHTELTGGFAEVMYVHPNSIVHRIDASIPAEIAAMYNSIAAGIRWAVHLGGVRSGDVVVIFGAGQRGIASAMAAKAAGASQVIITGLTRDAHKLKVATRFGADATIDAEIEDVPARVLELTGGRLADVVVDVTPIALAPIQHAIDVARIGGTIVVAGLKNGRPASISTDQLITKSLRILAARGVDSRSIDEAIALIESRKYPLELLQTHSYSLDDVALAISVLGGEVPTQQAINVVLLPN